ncbi:conserved hypothetical protein [Ricinus communis]|uniref:Uncharacterized protein n=1 Tax=Ricinus communis TaxID=3988 RepID=B9T0W4_RICCO|nr:conserved hypothetical protein [Ricinus communis]
MSSIFNNGLLFYQDIAKSSPPAFFTVTLRVSFTMNYTRTVEAHGVSFRKYQYTGGRGTITRVLL